MVVRSLLALARGLQRGCQTKVKPTSEDAVARTTKDLERSTGDNTNIMAESKPARPASKRASTAPAAPKPPSTIDPSAILANHATLTGVFPITVGPNVVLNPYSKVVSSTGPVEIGEGCIIWERAVVGINSEASARDDEDPRGSFVMLESNCVVESGAQVSAKLVGEGTVIEAFANVGEGCVIGKVCIHASEYYHYAQHRLTSSLLSSSVKSFLVPSFHPTPSLMTSLLSMAQINEEKTTLSVPMQLCSSCARQLIRNS